MNKENPDSFNYYNVEAYLKVRKDTAVVVSAKEGTFSNNQIVFDENRRPYKILSVDRCFGPNVDNSKSSILIEGDFSSHLISFK